MWDELKSKETSTKSKIAIVIGIVIFTIVAVGFTYISHIKQENRVNTITGEVLEVDSTSILIEEIGAKGEAYVYFSDDTPIDNSGESINSSQISVGSKIEIKYTGGIREPYPCQIDQVVKIIVKE